MTRKTLEDKLPFYIGTINKLEVKKIRGIIPFSGGKTRSFQLNPLLKITGAGTRLGPPNL